MKFEAKYPKLGFIGQLGVISLFSLLALKQGWGNPVPASIVQSLAADDFAAREAAQNELENWTRKQSETAWAELHRLSLTASDPEVRIRCWEALREIVIEKGYKADGYLGIRMFEMPVDVPGDAKARQGIRVDWVAAGSAAAIGGLVAGDVIVGLNDAIWRGPGMNVEFGRKIASMRPGTEIALNLLQNGKVVTRKLAVGEKPTAQNPGDIDVETANRAAKEKFFRQWLDKQKLGAR